MMKFFTNNRTKTAIALSAFMLLSSFNIMRSENVQAKENMNFKAHKSYENLLTKYRKNIKKTAGVYFEDYELNVKKLNPKKVTVNFAYHDFNKDKIDELVVKFNIKGEETPLYEEVITYYNGKPKQVTVNGWFGGAGGQSYTNYYYDSEYFLESYIMVGVYEDYSKLKDGKLKKEISFFDGADKKINDKTVSEAKYESTWKKYSNKRGKYGIKLIKATIGNLKKYRKTYNSEAFKGKKI